MKATYLTTAAFLFFSIGLMADDRPNILFIYLDDFGWKDTGFMGSDFYETPNLDQLAAEGMVFTDAYSAAANCAPARASLLSGQYSPRHELYNVGTAPRGNAKHRRLSHVPGVDVLKPEIETWATRVQAAGYETATIGKWHLSKDPLPYGFDLNIGGTHSGSPPKGYYPPHPRAPGLDDVPENEYLTDTLNDRAVDFVRDQADRPWLLYLTHFAVHTPIQPKRELLSKYQQKNSGELHDSAAMATMIESVDHGVGELVAALEESGQRERTVILFFSDNGGYGPITDMDPLKGYKGTYYEGGIRVPFFVNWPGKVAPGTTEATPIIGVDLYPTICAITGAGLPQEQAMDGLNLLPLFFGDGLANPDRAIFWHFPAYLQSYNVSSFEQRDPLFRSRPCSVIRKGHWKLHHYFEDDAWELYSLSEDIGEAQNLAETRPTKLEELRTELLNWREGIGAPVPTTRNPDFDAAAEADAIRRALESAQNR